MPPKGPDVGVCPRLPPWHSFREMSPRKVPAISRPRNEKRASTRRLTLSTPGSAPSLVVLQRTPLMGGYRLSFSPSGLFHPNAEHCHLPGIARCRAIAPRSSHVVRALTRDKSLATLYPD